MGEERDVAALIAERRAADPRAGDGREPVGAAVTRRLLAATAATVAAATVVLVLALAVWA